MEKIIQWLIRKFLKDYHLHKNPSKTKRGHSEPDGKTGGD